jgi:hypothetical protein
MVIPLLATLPLTASMEDYAATRARSMTKIG